MHPLNDVVARIHRIGTFWKHVHFKGARCPAGGLKCLVPPPRSLHQRRPDGFGSAAIDVVLNGLDRRARLRACRGLLDPAMTHDEPLVERCPERGRIVPEFELKIAGAWIIAARWVA